jgi:GrpB-like predicted nucleotidyltransferase (UPF0157 family)
MPHASLLAMTTYTRLLPQSKRVRSVDEGTRQAVPKPVLPGRRGVLRFPSPGEDWGRSGTTIARMTAPLSDEEIQAATIGELQPHAATIHLEDYDPAWPRLYEREAERIGGALGPRVLRIEHTGSTSVPGLAAKPLIDIVLVVADTRDQRAYVPPLEAAGYVLRIREPDWHEHRLFKGPATNVNVHTFSDGCSEVERMVAFRDWLRTHDDDRELYESAKRELAAREWKYVQNYADAKSAVVEEILARALNAT